MDMWPAEIRVSMLANSASYRGLLTKIKNKKNNGKYPGQPMQPGQVPMQGQPMMGQAVPAQEEEAQEGVVQDYLTDNYLTSYRVRVELDKVYLNIFNIRPALLQSCANVLMRRVHLPEPDNGKYTRPKTTEENRVDAERAQTHMDSFHKWIVKKYKEIEAIPKENHAERLSRFDDIVDKTRATFSMASADLDEKHSKKLYKSLQKTGELIEKIKDSAREERRQQRLKAQKTKTSGM